MREWKNYLLLPIRTCLRVSVNAWCVRCVKPRTCASECEVTRIRIHTRTCAFLRSFNSRRKAVTSLFSVSFFSAVLRRDRSLAEHSSRSFAATRSASCKKPPPISDSGKISHLCEVALQENVCQNSRISTLITNECFYNRNETHQANMIRREQV